MTSQLSRAVFWARRAGLTLIGVATCIYASFFFIPAPETETLSAAAAFWGMTAAYLTGGVLLHTPST